MMMKPKFEFETESVTDLSNGHEELLNDIEELSKALYLHKTPIEPICKNRSKSVERTRTSKPPLNSNPRFVSQDVLIEDKKLSSKWNWKKPLKALTFIGSQKFVCRFSLHVHSIEGLPSSFEGVRLSVHWKRKNSILQTCPSRVLNGSSEFDETLIHRCTVHGSRTVSGRALKYESKCFLIYASVVGEPEHNIGKHQVDLTRLLPRSLEDLLGNQSSGKWSTNFRLTGKALGARINVSFSYQVMKDELMGFGFNNVNVGNIINLKTGASSTDNVVGFNPNNRDVKLRQDQNDAVSSNEAVMNSGSGFSESITFLYQKLDEGSLKNLARADSESSQGSNLYVSDDTDFSTSEQGVGSSEGDSFEFDQTGIQIVDMSTIEIINVDEIIKDDETFVDDNERYDSLDTVCSRNEDVEDSSKHKFSFSCVDPPCTKVEDSVPETSEFLGQEDYLNFKSDYKAHKKSHSLDDIIDTVASDFLKTLALGSDSFRSSCDGDPLSPREQLLRQFEDEALGSGNFTFDFDAIEEELGEDTRGHNFGDFAADSDLSLIICAAEEEFERENQSLVQRRKAKILEDLETDSLMQQWGLDERDFENSSRTWSGGFGSPIELSDEEPSVLPSIGEGLGSFVQTTSGGFLRSMCPSLFKNVKNCGNLIIQASNAVVLPAKMGNDILDILLNMASARVQELCGYITKLMPLQDITGKSIKYIVSDADTNTETSQGLHEPDLFEEFSSYLTDKDKCLESVSLEAIAPMSIDKIEALLIEGLRIQSGMSNEEAPSCIHCRNEEYGNNLDGLMGLSVTLDLWSRLDSGVIQGEHNLERILKILKAHNSKITELDNEGLRNCPDKAKVDDRKHGYFGNYTTVAFMIQHRNPLRNYEAVGVPMLVLTQVERVDTHTTEKETLQSKFKIKEIHLAGVLTTPGKRQVWGTASQQQSGLRWLLASGMCSTVKHSSSKSKAIIVRSPPLFTNKLLNQDIFWSISCIKDNMNTNTHARNVDIIFPN
ncbi:protein PLASTID MOVEMENT IMPAIRED 1-RELATED 1-like [Vicia villosa]|uniref:protein PLASTID MOVEMENT IMPAIRED 1-RELATED 1-like n=1 Tax=Vicia villosa TaxID=3911 RepID=UPI00273C05B5|nr:protein PLASTID MOVEMENT IMPAIRED 1-RELATED 1-like [Vicia villosa]